VSGIDNASIFAVPAVPVGPKAEGRSDAYTERVTRQLSAAAYVRPNRLLGLRREVAGVRKRMLGAVRERLRLPAKERPGAAGGEGEPQAPEVVLGVDYAVWVRERITTAAHRIPAHGFDEGAVLRACDASLRQARSRGTALAAVLVGAFVLLALGWLTAGTALVVALVGCWAVFLAERYASQRMVNALLGGELPTGAAEPPSHALPYVREMRKGGPRDRFLGAGLQAWRSAVIGIDVEPAPEEQEDDGPVMPSVPGQTRGSWSEDLAARALAGFSERGGRSGARKPMKHFEDTDLHAYVMKRLSNPAPSHPSGHPRPRIDVVCVAGVSATRWAKLDDDAWRSMRSLAVNDRIGDVPGGEVARRYIWARITAFNGELVASVLVHFAYEGAFLRVTVRPHIMAPLNPVVEGISAENPRTPRWFGLAALHAVGDIVAGTVRLVRRGPRPVPELGEGPDPVSLREVYSLRWISDMHMNDDAQYYVQMMQRRVFDFTETFLRDHNVDIAAYRQQVTAVYNYGVMNGGTINGDVQAAPFSADIQMG
jgi:hypothetical protein